MAKDCSPRQLFHAGHVVTMHRLEATVAQPGTSKGRGTMTLRV